jgi:hypothetical protein
MRYWLKKSLNLVSKDKEHKIKPEASLSSTKDYKNMEELELGLR